ncbi:unnamed protein product [Notodromas monacha]|uniref:Proteasome subunit beta n=1 Tax=Notodromas monacha TaxID=399045 RepID=A0A7R9G8P2_9CRUS|nr:unnamed protein product [Notodromas monacha]CAG0912303.1 unnamed protein product [Notodromas monacha]
MDSITAYNGGAVLAMTGKECVAIASDRRFGVKLHTLGTDFTRIFDMGPHMYIGYSGLGTDVQTVQERLSFRKNFYELREGRKMHPNTFSHMVANFLYEHRFGPYFIEPVIAGLDPITFEPIVGGMDLIGCVSFPTDFVVGGTCTEQLYGMCESLWRPKMDPEDLFECASQALVNAFDRDAISGWGATVYIIEKDKVTVRTLKTRMD